MINKQSYQRANVRDRRANRRGPPRGRQNIGVPAQGPLKHAIDRHFMHITETEPVTPITVPLDSKQGTLLYAVEINPRKLGRILAAAATQGQSWAGNFTFQLRVNGSVNARNYAIARFFPDADLEKLPDNADELWRYVRATTSGDPSNKMARALDRAFVKYNVISDKACNVSAAWEQSYNPIKPMVDTDPSEANLGVFVIVSNGPPGEEVVIDVDVKEDVYLCGPAPRSVLIDNSVLATATPTSLSQPFGPNWAQQGNGALDHTINTYTITQPGKYLVEHYYAGTGITAMPNVTTDPNVTITAIWNSVGSSTSTVAIQTFIVSFTEGRATIRLGNLPATTWTQVRLRIVSYSAE